MLALASLLLATLVSMAVVGWMPRPAPPPMRLDQAMQVLRGERSATPLGLHLETRASPPPGQQQRLAHPAGCIADGPAAGTRATGLEWP